MLKKIVCGCVILSSLLLAHSSVITYAQSSDESKSTSYNESSAISTTDSSIVENNQTQDRIPAKNEYYTGRVLEVLKEDNQGESGYTANLKILILEGPDKGQARDIVFQRLGLTLGDQKVKAGETVILIKTQDGAGFSYFVVDKYRLTSALVILFIFIFVTVVVSRWKGVFSLFGLMLSIVILVFMVVPALIAGQDPVWVGLWGSALIAISSMYLAHGLSSRTNVAVLSTFITLAIAVGMSIWFVSMTKLFGFGTEEATYLNNGVINLRGLLLCGILIGTLGILDDITVSQVSIVEEIHDVDNTQSMWELFKRGTNVGREHIASLINTLALAYVGASFPLLLTFTINQGQPLWVILNSESIMEEIVRTMVGSLTLILAVPIATLLAAYFCKHPFKIRNKKLEDFYKKLEPKTTHHHHHHH